MAPNHLLKYARESLGWSQQFVAEQIDAPGAFYISRWERGKIFPSPHYRERLCKLFGKQASELGLLPGQKTMAEQPNETVSISDTIASGLPDNWNIPFHRNPFFTGREDLLSTLHACLHPDQGTPGVQLYALQGLGGVGKTQVALEYAYRYVGEYNALFWIESENCEQILASFRRIAGLLHLCGQQADQSCIVAVVQHWLSTHSCWLLIWDNLEDLELLLHFLPPVRQGAILVTTRSATSGTLAQGLEVPPLGQEEAVHFLLRRAKRLVINTPGEKMRQCTPLSPKEEATAAQLVQEMGGLPLALDQAGAYIEETGCGFSGYMRQYEQVRYALLNRRGGGSPTHPDSIAATLSLACQRVARQNNGALDLLYCCAFLSPDDIPEELFVRQESDPKRTPTTFDLYQLNEALAVLRSFSLVQRYPETHTLSLHRLVQVVLREQLSEQDRLRWIRIMIVALNASFPQSPQNEWKQCERLLPHVLLCASFLPDSPEEQELAELLRKTANYLRVRAQYQQGEELYRRALRLRELGLGKEHPLVAFPLNGLALLLSEQGRYEQGEVLCLRALQIREQALGPTHPLIAQSLNNLSVLYKNQGKYEQAEEVCLRALHILEQTPGQDQADVAQILNNLSVFYLKRGKYKQAIQAAERALSIWEQQHGVGSLLTAASLCNLTNMYRELGEYEQAERVCLRGLQVLKQNLPPEHPRVGSLLTNLGSVYSAQGKYEQAIPLHQQALLLCEQALGKMHPNVAEPLIGLANIYREQGQCSLAEPMYQRALQIQSAHLGEQHPETAQILYDLALLHKDQQNYEQARPLLKRARTIFKNSLGQSHPQTVKARNAYQSLLTKQKNVKIHQSQKHSANLPEHPSPNHRLQSAPSQETTIRQDDQFTNFLTTRCELHPHAWSRASDLWTTYRQWVKDHQERFLLSRRAFATQLKVHGCRADRMSNARIWRGITTASKRMMTDDDG